MLIVANNLVKMRMFKEIFKFDKCNFHSLYDYKKLSIWIKNSIIFSSPPQTFENAKHFFNWVWSVRLSLRP